MGVSPGVWSRYTREQPLRAAMEVWSYTRVPRGLKVPRWYSIFYGTPPWVLTQSVSRLSEKQRALALIVRMNFISDHWTNGKLFGPGAAFCKSPPQLPLYLRESLRAYRSTLLQSCIKSAGRNLSWAYSPNYNWRAVLACTVRRYVNLVLPSRPWTGLPPLGGLRAICARVNVP
jgi:hypothetical protein